MTHPKWKLYFLLCFILCACSSQVIQQTTTPTIVENTLALPFFAAQLRPTPEPRPFRMAQMTGVLIVENGCLRMREEQSDKTFLVLWSAEPIIKQDSVFDPRTNKTAFFGQRVELSGGEIPADSWTFTQLKQPIPSDCHGPYWEGGRIEQVK
ncbi:MAG: hypothetical protein KAX40_02655 [Herpetosiphon sp.]|nr:hypothetical protein [Herpetosiphon sp.]